MKLTITEKDQAKAGDYSDHYACLVHTMLGHRGYRNIKVLPHTVVDDRTKEVLFSIKSWMEVLDAYDWALNRVNKSAIGQEIELVEA